MDMWGSLWACSRAHAVGRCDTVPPAHVDPLRIVEAAYAWVEDEAKWLDGIVRASEPYALGAGVVAFTVTCDGRTKIETLRASESTPSSIAEVVGRFCEHLPASIGAEVFAPTEFVGNAAYRLERLAKARTVSVAALSSNIAVPPLWALIAGAPMMRSLVILFPAKQEDVVQASDPFPHRDSRLLGLAGAHLGAALRLRHLGQAPSADDETIDAVLTPSGNILHAKAGAAHARVRASLSEAVLRSERARGQLRHVDSVEAMEHWTALVGGRYSIVETSERDGKRFLLARKNSLRGPDLLALTKEESDVVWLTAQGHSHKYVAYELGLSVASIVRRLRSAMLKLRVSSRRDLLRKLGLPRG